jgi:hypothetical protein
MCSGVGFRKTVATLIDDERLSARIGADHLSDLQRWTVSDRAVWTMCGHEALRGLASPVADLERRPVILPGWRA